MGGLDPNHYKVAVNELSTEWASLSAEEQEAFQVQAAYEQQLREAAVHEPLPAKGVEASDPDLNSKLGSKALKKLSIARLQNNFDLAIKHKLWESPTQLGECFLPRLPTFFCHLFLATIRAQLPEIILSPFQDEFDIGQHIAVPSSCPKYVYRRL